MLSQNESIFVCGSNRLDTRYTVFLSSIKFVNLISSMSSLMFLRTDWTQVCADDTGNSLLTFPVPRQVSQLTSHLWRSPQGQRRRVTQRFPIRIIRDSHVPFAFVTLSRFRFFIPLLHFARYGWKFFFRPRNEENEDGRGWKRLKGQDCLG